MSKRRVVITGYGAISPVGNTATETWNGLVSGKNGIEKEFLKKLRKKT